MGRGLYSVEFKSKCMLLQLWETLDKYKNILTRRAAILKVEEENKTHLSLITLFLKTKYSIDEIDMKALINAQSSKLYCEISKKVYHAKLYKARNNELVSLKDSSV